MKLISGFTQTPEGSFGALETEAGEVVASGWTDSEQALLARIPRLADASVTAGTPACLVAAAAHGDGELGAIDAVPVLQFGTPLQLRFWRELRGIPAGAPISYAQLAEAAEVPAAVRAAGAACGRNAPALFVPCHRVVGSGGAVTGFAWGVEVKRALLAREAVAAAAQH